VAAAVSFNAATRVLTINPTANLANDTLYTVTLTGGTAAAQIHDVAGNPFATTTWTFRTGPAPTLTGRVPASGATGASRTANLSATFSEAMALATINTTNVTLRRGTTPTGVQVAVALTPNAARTAVTINPTLTLAANQQYTVRLTGLTDAAGNPLPASQWSFTTGP
jgi:hypothetical protein